MGMDSGTWILIIGFFVVIATMIGLLKYDKYKRTKHMRAYEKSMKKKYSSHSITHEEDEAQPISDQPPPLIKKIKLKETGQKILVAIRKRFKLLFKPLSLLLLFIVRYLIKLIILIMDIKWPKFTFKPTALSIHKKRYLFAFIVLFSLLSILALNIKFRFIQSLFDKNDTATEQTFKSQGDKQNYYENKVMEKDGTRVVINNSQIHKPDTTKSKQIETNISAEVKTISTPKTISKTPPKIIKPKPKKTEDEYLLIF